MDLRLRRLVKDYQEAVSAALKLMTQSQISLPTSNVAWACSDLPQVGVLEGDVKYFKHGYGCAVHLPSGVVDFDFGEHGETDGFDLWRLNNFAEDRLLAYGFASESELKACFAGAVEAGAIRYSGYILHYLVEPDV